MKAAAAVFYEEDFAEISTYEKLLEKADSWFNCCGENSVDVIVLPALMGCLYSDGERYIDNILRLSLNYRELAICPGSFYEKMADCTYHSSCIITDGRVVLRQRQIYLAKWEKGMKLSRGAELNYVSLKGLKTAIIISTDLFYPQVSRTAAMSGAELILAPAAIKGGRNFSRQLSGLWQNVQQNLFFGIESGFKGSFDGNEFYSRSIIHGPLELTERDNGLLSFENKGKRSPAVCAELDNDKRKLAVERFDTLSQLNVELYKDMTFLDDGGKK